jgi:phosphate transport system substrate-binding protein
LARQADETSLEIIRKFLPPFRELSITADAKIAYHDYQMVDLLNKYSGGIGFLTFGSLANPLSKIRVLALDGIMPTPDNLSSGSYPMKLSLGFVYKKDQLSELSSKFLSFVFSNEGRAIIKHLGLFPVERRE